MTPNASISVPTTTYSIKKLVDCDINFEFHIKCSGCKVFSSTASEKSITKCVICDQTIKAMNSEHFIYIPIKQQLMKTVSENFDQIMSHLSGIKDSSSIMTDVHHSTLHKKIYVKYKNVKILSLSVNTDGAMVHKTSSK